MEYKIHSRFKETQLCLQRTEEEDPRTNSFTSILDIQLNSYPSLGIKRA